MSATATVHRYRAGCSWSGSTADGYDAYDRDHDATAAPATAALALSADPAFGGDAERLNPEQLLVAAASSCQLLSFLAVAARARIDVREYSDDAEGEMPEDDRPMRIVRIVLRPRIVVAPGPDESRVRELVEVAHRHCFIANSLTTQIDVEPRIEFAAVTRATRSGQPLMEEQEFDVVVVGGGPAGEVCAGRLGDHGLEVVLVEDDLVGGECSYYACMPSKGLLRPGELLAEVQRVPGAREAVTGELDVEATLKRRDEIVHDFDDSGQEEWLDGKDVTLVRGHGRLDGERRVVVDDQVLIARRAVVVAAGTGALIPDDHRAARVGALDQPRGHHRQGRSRSAC